MLYRVDLTALATMTFMCRHRITMLYLEENEMECIKCGKYYARARYLLGKLTCLECGESAAKQKKHTVVPLHKSNYMVPANKAELTGINNKGGLTR